MTSFQVISTVFHLFKLLLVLVTLTKTAVIANNLIRFLTLIHNFFF